MVEKKERGKQGMNKGDKQYILYDSIYICWKPDKTDLGSYFWMKGTWEGLLEYCKCSLPAYVKVLYENSSSCTFIIIHLSEWMYFNSKVFFSNTLKKSSIATMRIWRPTWFDNMAVNGTLRKAIPGEKWVESQSRVRWEISGREKNIDDNYR